MIKQITIVRRRGALIEVRATMKVHRWYLYNSAGVLQNDLPSTPVTVFLYYPGGSIVALWAGGGYTRILVP